MDRRAKVARLSIISNTILIVLKLIVGFLTQSVSIISEAIHSGLDLAAAVIAFYSVKTSVKPADAEHQYGHGKIENISGTIEALLVFIAAAWIIYEAVKKLVRGESALVTVELGIVVMLISAVVNWVVSGQLSKTARETDSVALEADALHLRTDVYTSLGVLLGLLAIKVTGILFLDPLIALLVAALIIKASVDLTKQAFLPLMDVGLPVEEQAIIQEVMNTFAGDYVEYHKFRTRKAGADRYVDLHLVVPHERSVNEVHDLCHLIENEIAERLPHTQVLIHAEPCTKDCTSCTRDDIC
jgi:cation diffusion facilitator family transporter